MRIALVHNERAGDRAHSSDKLLELFRALGHVVDSCGRDEASLLHALNIRPDVFVVSGGDGTVARVAIALCGSETPMFVLPTGTANNIATSIGVGDRSVVALAERLTSTRVSRLDVWKIAGAGHETSFVEGTGVGVIGTMLEREQHEVNSIWHRVQSAFNGAFDHWESTARYVAALLREEPARWINVEADGQDLSGEYITVEVMNINAIGPRIRLAADADPGDGYADLVLITAGMREQLAERIESGSPAGADVLASSRRVRRVMLDWPESGRHVDDDDWPAGKPANEPKSVSIAARGTVKLLIAE